MPPAAKLDGKDPSDLDDLPPPALGATGTPPLVLDTPIVYRSASSPPGSVDRPKVSPSRFEPDFGEYPDAEPGGRLPSGRGRWYYVMPGTIFLLFSFFVILLVLSRMILPFLMLVRAEVLLPAGPDSERLTWAGLQAAAGTLIGIAIGGVYFLGGVAMIRRRGLSMARVAAIVACVPCLNAVVLTPIGVWACVLAFGPNAKRDFNA